MKQFFTTLILLLITGLGYAQQRKVIYLPQAQFSTGNDKAWSAVSFNDQQWKTIKTGTVWQEQGFADYHGYAWYRIHVVIPSSLKQSAIWKDSVRLFLAHVNDVDETYLNGVKLGKTGSFPDDEGGYVSKWPAVRQYLIPANDPSIHWDHENIIAIKVYDGGGTGGIFMGAPFVDMPEKIDGLTLNMDQDSILFQDSGATVPLVTSNRFNTTVSGTLNVVIRDQARQRNFIQKKQDLTLKPFQTYTLHFKVPNQSGMVLSYTFTQQGTTLKLDHSQVLPYILTPDAPLLPRINSAAVLGVHPGSPVLFKIAATGRKPLRYRVQGLPKGLQVDEITGLITGSLTDSDVYRMTIEVSNTLGKKQQDFTIKAGHGLALTPTMGWNSWNCWGIQVSEEKVKSSAQALIDKGLADYGWSYINIDDGWQAPHRAGDSTIVANEKFSNMKGLGDWLHQQGLKFGIYSSPGPLTCGGFEGSYRNEQHDAATYARWGVDYLKYDWCSYDGVARGDTSLSAYIKPYALMDAALRDQKRDIIYSLCQYGMKDVWKWGEAVHGQSWRTTEDIEDSWESMKRIGFEQYPLYPYAGPGHWNDPDMMIVGQVGWGENLHPSRLSPDEQYTHVSLWCMLSAPLLIGCDLSRLNAFILNLLTNPEVLSIDQDVLGRQAERKIDKDGWQIWVKPLSDGSKAIAVFNMDTTYRNINIPWGELNFNKQQTVRDVWRQKDLGWVKNYSGTLIAPHGVLLLKIK